MLGRHFDEVLLSRFSRILLIEAKFTSKPSTDQKVPTQRKTHQKPYDDKDTITYGRCSNSGHLDGKDHDLLGQRGWICERQWADDHVRSPLGYC
jgi:hypothetical protein